MAAPELIVTFWDVGQGDCTTIELADGSIIIVDTGPRGSPLVDWLKQRRPRVRALVITHNDSDHVGAIPSVLAPNGVTVDHVFWLVDRPPKNAPFAKLLRLVQQGEDDKRFQVTRLEVGAVVYEDAKLALKIWVVHPTMMANIAAARPNQTSGIIVLERAGRTEIVWPGDAGLDQVASKCENKQPMIMVGPHHGAPEGWRHRTNTFQNIKRIGASRGYISVGTKNSYNHPRPKYIRLLEAAQTKVCCSQLTYFCDNRRVAAKKPVMQTHAILGLKPPRSGITCRGPLQLMLTAAGWVWDGLDEEHQKRSLLLRRAQCVLGRKYAAISAP